MEPVYREISRMTQEAEALSAHGYALTLTDITRWARRLEAAALHCECKSLLAQFKKRLRR